MKAIEFDAKVENGVIKVPQKYLDNLKDRFRIIILIEEKAGKRKKISILEKKWNQ